MFFESRAIIHLLDVLYFPSPLAINSIRHTSLKLLPHRSVGFKLTAACCMEKINIRHIVTHRPDNDSAFVAAQTIAWYGCRFFLWDFISEPGRRGNGIQPLQRWLLGRPHSNS